MKVEKISTKFIKPHTPTPQTLKNYNISFKDKFIVPLNISVLLFYESTPENNTQLQESLAKILVQFYPLAGRYIKTHEIIDCSDQGIEFVEAKALDVELLDLISNIEIERLKILMPDQFFRVDEGPDDPIMSIQATFFNTGGMAISISASHRVIDGSSLGMFLTAWSKASNPNISGVLPVTFDLPRLLPNKDYEVPLGGRSPPAQNSRIIVKRLLFDNEALSRLRLRISPRHHNVSRARVVSAVIAKAVINMDRAKLGGMSRDFVILQPINMRERTILPVPMHSCGNLAMMSLSRRVASKDIGLHDLVDLIGESIQRSIVEYSEILSPNRDGRDIIINGTKKFLQVVSDTSTNVINISDLSKFGFYEIDFGWGKPVLTSSGPYQLLSGSTFLMSNKEGDGIEAWVYLNQDDVHYFGQDEEIKLYTTRAVSKVLGTQSKL